jgi:hypothetical protein
MRRHHSCGICGIVNFKGITWTDLQYFTEVLKKSEDRGHHATGVALQSLDFLKAGIPAKDFILRHEFRDILKRAIGQKWIVGHTRWATQGDPSNNWNNHPVTALPGKYLLVHNGIVGTDKFDENTDKVDTFVVANAIKKEWREEDLFTTVQESYKSFYGSAAIAVVDHSEIILARRDNPIVMGTLKSGAITFASEEKFLKNKYEKAKDIVHLPDNTIVGYDQYGAKKSGTVERKERPYTTYYGGGPLATSTYYNPELPEEPPEEEVGIEDIWKEKEEPDAIVFGTEHTYDNPQTRIIGFWEALRKKEEKEKKKKGKGWWKQKRRHRKAFYKGRHGKKHKSKYRTWEDWV